MSDEIGWTAKHQKIISQGYDEIAELYKQISFYDILDIKRAYPRYFKAFDDTEREIDRYGDKMNTANMKHQVDKMVTAWENIVHKVKEEIQAKVKKGMPRPLSKASYKGLAIYRDDLYMQNFVDVGYCTFDEVRDWLDKKITIAEIKKRNEAEYNAELGHRFNRCFLIQCSLSDDGSLKGLPKEVLVPKPISVPQNHSEDILDMVPSLEPKTSPLPSEDFEGGEMELNLNIEDSWK